MGEFGDLSLLVGFGDLSRRALEDGRAGGSASLLLLVGFNDLGRRVSDVGSLFGALGHRGLFLELSGLAGCQGGIRAHHTSGGSAGTHGLGEGRCSGSNHCWTFTRV